MFENIIGNDKIKKELINAVNLNKYSHSYLFLGTSGIGKKKIAREFAKMILCREEHKYCGKCKSCIEFDSNNHPDFIEIQPDGSAIKIDQIREMQYTVFQKPIISNKKVYIIDNADLMTKEAQNCLLKTLEEPPEFVCIILVGSNEGKFLSTIKSRTLCVKFEKIQSLKIEEYLKEKYGITEIASSVIEAANGSIGKAEFLMNKQDLYIEIDKIIQKIGKLDLIDTLKNSEIIYKSQEDIQEILEYTNMMLFKKAKENIRYLNCIKYVEEAKSRLNANSNYNMTIDNMIMSIWEEIH